MEKICTGEDCCTFYTITQSLILSVEKILQKMRLRNKEFLFHKQLYTHKTTWRYQETNKVNLLIC